ncbi:hypothetical protein HDV00_005825 [Rhizophlyctis rosea]|nr:hypothetical protein HDV00_005825 [Rhizophlyctis rosea]
MKCILVGYNRSADNEVSPIEKVSNLAEKIITSCWARDLGTQNVSRHFYKAFHLHHQAEAHSMRGAVMFMKAAEQVGNGWEFDREIGKLACREYLQAAQYLPDDDEIKARALYRAVDGAVQLEVARLREAGALMHFEEMTEEISRFQEELGAKEGRPDLNPNVDE